MACEPLRTLLMIRLLFLVSKFQDHRFTQTGAGAFEIACHADLMKFKDSSVTGLAKLGVQVFAESLLVIPKTLAENAGFDALASVLALQVCTFAFFALTYAG